MVIEDKTDKKIERLEINNMTHIYYSDTNIESFKTKFQEVVTISDQIFPINNSGLIGEMYGNNFEVRSGYIGSSDLSLFAPVINGTMHSRGQRTMVSLAPRLGIIGVVMTVVLISMGIILFLLFVLSDNDDSKIRGMVASLLVPAFFWLMGFWYYSSKSTELIRDITGKLNLNHE